MLTLPNPRLLACLPALLAAASCVPPPAAKAGRVASASTPAAMPGFSFELAPPPTSLARLAPAEEAKWHKAAGLFAAPSAAPAAPFRHAGAEDDRQRALDCLTAAVYYEARSEGEDGQRAVAQVVLNRARHPAFPSSVCGVVYQGSQRRTGCQFSFTCDGSTGRRRVAWAWDKARGIAAAALAGEVYAPVGNATHYHTRAVLPYWASSLTRSATVGAHIFYRWRGGAGGASAFRQRPSASEGAPVRVVTAQAKRVRIHRAAVERVEAEGSVIRIHRGAPPAAATETAASVRVHVGTPPITEG